MGLLFALLAGFVLGFIPKFLESIYELIVKTGGFVILVIFIGLTTLHGILGKIG